MNSSQRSAIQTFSSFTNDSEQRALEYLKRFNWDIAQATDDYFTNLPQKEVKRIDESILEKVFEKYADTTKSVIGGDGFGRFYQDIKIDLADMISLAIPWQLRAKTIGMFTKEEFIDGWKRLGCSNISEMKAHITMIRTELNDDRVFKEFYFFVFDYAKGPQEHKKVLELDNAIEMWKTVLRHKFKLLDEWIKFVKEEHGKPINRDTWCLLLDFAKISIQDYDDDGAWPSLVDEFVNHIKNNQQQN